MNGRRAGFFLYAKRRLTLAELVFCFDIVDEISAAIHEKKYKSAYRLHKDLIRLLTTRDKYVFPWDIFSIKKVFQAHGMINDKSGDVEKPGEVKRKLYELAATLAAQTGGTAWEKLQNLTTEEIKYHTDAVLKEKLEKWKFFAMAYHAPKQLFEILSEVENYLSQKDSSSESELSLKDRLKKAIERSPNINSKLMPHQERLPSFLSSGGRS